MGEPARSEIRPLGGSRPPRPEAQQHPCERKLRLENLRLRSCPYTRPTDDWLRIDEVLPSAGDHAHMAKI